MKSTSYSSASPLRVVRRMPKYLAHCRTRVRSLAVLTVNDFPALTLAAMAAVDSVFFLPMFRS